MLTLNQTLPNCLTQQRFCIPFLRLLTSKQFLDAREEWETAQGPDSAAALQTTETPNRDTHDLKDLEFLATSELQLRK